MAAPSIYSLKILLCSCCSKATPAAAAGDANEVPLLDWYKSVAAGLFPDQEATPRFSPGPQTSGLIRKSFVGPALLNSVAPLFYPLSSIEKLPTVNTFFAEVDPVS